MRIEPRINGRATPLDVQPQELLLDVLRDRLDLRGAKRSCDVQVCGACTVLVDGAPVSACTYLAVEADARDVTTIEGFRDTPRYERIAAAFTRHAAVQCGFCTPALVLTIHALLGERDRERDEGRDQGRGPEIVDDLAGNLCRCTGYRAILEAVRELDAEAVPA